MATIYEGTERNQQQVDERIDPEILRALGLSDVSDLDYDEYKTLLKERLAANRMNTSQKAREDSARLDEKILNEFKRVKAETGRFRVRNERVSYQKMLPGTANGGGGGLVQNITFQQQPAQEEGEDETQAQVQGLNDFLTNVVAPSLSKIESSLLSILENLTGQQKAEEKAASSARIAGQKAQKRAKENRFEGLGVMASKAANVAKKVFSPLAQIFGAIFNFLSNVLTGFLVLKVLDWIKDPRKLFVDIGNMFIMFLNAGLKLMFGLMFSPFNAFISGLNSGINLFEEAVNNTIGKIPGIPRLELPEIPPIEPPQIPMIPYPKEENKEPKKQQKTPKVPATAMAEGGPVTNIYNIMSDGGQVRTDTGQKVTGAGPDTQLVALQPGEFVMSKGAVDTFGLDTMMDMNSMGGGTNKPKMARVQSVGSPIMAMQGGGSVVEHLHGEPGRQGYRADHGGGNAHDHYAFSSEALRKYIQKHLASGNGPSGRKYQIGSTTGGKHAPDSYHYVGQALDIPWSQFGSGKITQKDFAQSQKLDKDVRALVAQFNGSENNQQPNNNNTTQVQPQNNITGQPVSEDFYAEGPKGFQSSVHPSASAKGLYKKLGINENVWRTYKDTIASIETSSHVNSASTSYSQIGGTGGGYDGRYQMGTMGRKDAARILGVPLPSRQEYRSNPQLQEDLFLAYTVANHGYLMNSSEKFRNATPIQRMQYLGYAHNQGWGKAADWLETGVISSVDGFGTKGTKFTDKLAKTLAPYSGRDVSGSPETQRQQLQSQQTQQSGNNSGQISSMPGTTDTQYEKTPYGGDLPMVSLGPLQIDDSGGIGSILSSDFKNKPIKLGDTSFDSVMNKTPPPPPSRSGSGGQVPPVLVPKDDTSTSSTSSQGSTSPMFSPLDMSNPDLIVVKAIYNIVG